MADFETEFENALGALRERFKQGHATLAEATLTPQDDIDAIYSTALKLLRMNKDQEAVSVLSTLTVIDCYDVRYWRALGLGLYKTKRTKLALTVLNAALCINQNDVATHTYRAETLLALGRTGEAGVECEWVIAHGTQHQDAPFAARAKALQRYTKA